LFQLLVGSIDSKDFKTADKALDELQKLADQPTQDL
jgi:hypothetical protein